MRDSDRVVLAACLGAALMSFAACGGSSSSSNGGITTTPTPQPKTETFSGTVAVRGCSPNNFTTTADGEVDVTLAATAPSVTMSVYIGTPVGGTCSAIFGPASLTAGSSPVTGNATAGTYCVNVCDSGAQTAPVNYTVTVQHQ